MSWKFLKNKKTITIFLLTFCLIFCFCACTTNSDNKKVESQVDNSVKGTPKFLVTVTDTDGNVVEGVVLQMIKKSKIISRTDKNGVAVFPIADAGGYILTVLNCPSEYEYIENKKNYIQDGIQEYKIEIRKK